jgi:hypothetical protein
LRAIALPGNKIQPIFYENDGEKIIKLRKVKQQIEMRLNLVEEHCFLNAQQIYNK